MSIKQIDGQSGTEIWRKKKENQNNNFKKTMKKNRERKKEEFNKLNVSRAGKLILKN